MESQQDKIIKEYPFQKIQWWLIPFLVIAIVFFIVQTWIDREYIAAYLNLLQIAVCLLALWFAFLGKSSKNRNRIVLKADSVLGPLWSRTKNQEIQIKFTEIKSFEHMPFSSAAVKISDSKNEMIIQSGSFQNEKDFIEIYNFIAQKLNRPQFEDVANEFEKISFESSDVRFKTYRTLWYSLVFFVITTPLSFVFAENLIYQMDCIPIYIITFIVIAAWDFYFLKTFKILKTLPYRRMILSWVIYTFVFGQFCSFFGVGGLISYVNQKLDQSEMTVKSYPFIVDHSQSEEDKKKRGQCYVVEGATESSLFFTHRYCLKRDPDFKPDDTFVDYYKKGLFGLRWYVNEAERKKMGYKEKSER